MNTDQCVILACFAFTAVGMMFPRLLPARLREWADWILDEIEKV
jgi:hypothetical protein